MTSPTEDLVQEALRTLPVTAAPDRMSRVLARARQRRRRQAVAAAAATVLAVAGVTASVAAWPHGAQTQKVVGLPTSYPGDPKIRYVGQTNTTGTLEDNVTRFGPPHDPSAAIPAPDALHDAWSRREVKSSTGARLVLAHLSAAKLHGDRDVWLVIIYGHIGESKHSAGRVNKTATLRRASMGPTEPLMVAIDARTGRWLFSASGNEAPRNPMTILVAEPGSTIPVDGDLYMAGSHPAEQLQGSVTFTPVASGGSTGDAPRAVTVEASDNGRFVAHLQRQSYTASATSPQFRGGHTRCYPVNRHQPINPEDTRDVEIYCRPHDH